MTDKVKKLLDLISENPDLRIVPLVEEGIAYDDSCLWWLGEWGTAEVTEIYRGRERLHFRTDDEEDVLCDMVGCKFGDTKDGRDVYDLSDEEWTELFNSLEWEKVIVVYITS